MAILGGGGDGVNGRGCQPGCAALLTPEHDAWGGPTAAAEECGPTRLLRLRRGGEPVRRLWLLWLVGVAVLGGTFAWSRARAADRPALPVYYVATTQKVMALTFDVSWGETMLPKVLAILAREHQTATFFLSGPWSASHPELVRAIMAGGNEIASHGQQHVNLSDVANSAIANNIGSADAILRGYTGRPLQFFRPPNGDFDGRVVDVAHGLGYETVIWSIDSRDWMNPGVSSIVSRVVREAFPGAIILFHASDTCKQTDIALPTVISDLRAQGYRLVTLGELWKMGPAMRDDPRGSGRKPNMSPAPSVPSATAATANGAPYSCPAPSPKPVAA